MVLKRWLRKIKALLGRMAFLLARSSFGAWIVRFVFTRMSFLLPVHRLLETDRLIAFYHPKPVAPTHVLIVPKIPIRSLDSLTPEQLSIISEIADLAKQLVVKLNLNSGGYRLNVNGGSYQDVQQMHFHLISDVARSD